MLSQDEIRIIVKAIDIRRKHNEKRLAHTPPDHYLDIARLEAKVDAYLDAIAIIKRLSVSLPLSEL